jgi:hypothetical protein
VDRRRNLKKMFRILAKKLFFEGGEFCIGQNFELLLLAKSGFNSIFKNSFF